MTKCCILTGAKETPVYGNSEMLCQSADVFLQKIKYLAVNHIAIEKLSSLISTQHFGRFEL